MVLQFIIIISLLGSGYSNYVPKRPNTQSNVSLKEVATNGNLLYSRAKRAAENCEKGQLPCAYFDTASDNQTCVSTCQICDGKVDCPKATDEVGCPCRTRTRSDLLCDGKFDCADYTDELGCGECLNDELRCFGECVSLSDFCSGAKCYPFSRPLLCFRISRSQNDVSVEYEYRSIGYLHTLVRRKWRTACGTLETKIDVAVDQYCEAVTGVRGRHFYKLEEATSRSLRWSKLRINGDGIVSSAKTDSCSQVMVVYVECIPPPCQNSSKSSTEKYHAANLERIVGGRDVSPEVWTFLARITINGEHHCGGSVVTPRWILSAAHCFLKISGERFEVETGNHIQGTFAPSIQRRTVSHIIRHSEFDPYSMKNDVALVRLVTPLQFNRWTRPTCFSNELVIPLEEGVQCRLAGWGFQTEEGSLAETLQEIVIPILKKEDCTKEFYFIDPEQVVCAGYKNGGKDSCQGDSGGPMMCHHCNITMSYQECTTEAWYQAALVSFGRGCARPNLPGVYTQLQSYMTWIFGNIDLMGKDSNKLPTTVPKTSCDGIRCLHSSGLCLSKSLVCDGNIDCLDASDETKCDSTISTSNQSSSNSSEDIYEYDYIDFDLYNDYDDSDTLDDPLKISCPEKYYKCEKLPGCVPESLLCDGTRNCRDGTDELGCTCVDRLFQKQKGRICDGIVNCFDYTDEFCDLCPIGDWLCPRSGQCIDVKKRCDAVPDCRYGEDELHCLALTPHEGELRKGRDGFPLPHSGGYLLLYTSDTDSWDPICETEMERSIATDICSYLGFNPPLSIKYNSHLPPKYEIRIDVPIRTKRSISIRKAKHDFQSSGEGLTLPSIRKYNFKGSKNLEANFTDAERMNLAANFSDIEIKNLAANFTNSELEIFAERKITDFGDTEIANVTNEIWGRRGTNTSGGKFTRINRSFTTTNNTYNATDDPKSSKDDLKSFASSANITSEVGDEDLFYLLGAMIASDTFSGKSADGIRAKRMTCNQVHLECGDKSCGKIQSLHFSHAPPLGAASHVPWAVGIFHDGVYECGGTLVAMQWVITSLSCVDEKVFSDHEIHVLAGSNHGFAATQLLAPSDVDIRVDGLVEVDKVADLVLLHLEYLIENIEHVNAVCLDEYEDSQWKECIAVGPYEDNLHHAFLLSPQDKQDCPDEQMCFRYFFPSEDVCTNSWSGLISCRTERKSEHPWSAVAIWDFKPGNGCQPLPNSFRKFNSDLKTKIQTLMSAGITTLQPPLPCEGHKCSLGTCLIPEEVCDAKPACSDLSDESFQCPVPLKFCEISPGTDSCECAVGEFKCSDEVCLTSDSVCDGVAQCVNGEDEVNCECLMMTESSKEKQLCDGVIDCKDESDELQCGCKSEEEFRCFRSSNQTCIETALVCDAVLDCENGEDEAFCFSISSTFFPEENALGIPASSNKGYLLLRVKGRWYTFYSEIWDPASSEVVCLSLGYSGIKQTTSKILNFSMLEEIKGYRIMPLTLHSGKIGSNEEMGGVVYIECEI